MTNVYYRGLVYCRGVLLLSAAAACGEGPSEPEVSMGYSYVRANAPPGQCGCFNMNGLSGEFAARVGYGLSVVTDVGGYHQGDVVNSGLSLWVMNYLFGPRISYRRSQHWTPFAQFPAGGAHASGTSYGSSPGAAGSANAFALSAGGGLDFNASRHVSVRLFQLEYLNTRLPNSVNGFQNNLRLTVGVVIRFGKK